MQLPDGIRAKYIHRRRLDWGWNNNAFIKDAVVLPTGGVTICRLLDSENNVVAEGFAYCSDKDNYSKKIGRYISTGRALKELKKNSQLQLEIN